MLYLYVLERIQLCMWRADKHVWKIIITHSAQTYTTLCIQNNRRAVLSFYKYDKRVVTSVINTSTSLISSLNMEFPDTYLVAQTVGGCFSCIYVYDTHTHIKGHLWRTPSDAHRTNGMRVVLHLMNNLAIINCAMTTWTNSDGSRQRTLLHKTRAVYVCAEPTLCVGRVRSGFCLSCAAYPILK